MALASAAEGWKRASFSSQAWALGKKKKATYVLFSCIFKADFLVMVGFAVVRMNASSSLFLKMLFSLLGLIKLPNFSANAKFF